MIRDSGSFAWRNFVGTAGGPRPPWYVTKRPNDHVVWPSWAWYHARCGKCFSPPRVILQKVWWGDSWRGSWWSCPPPKKWNPKNSALGILVLYPRHPSTAWKICGPPKTYLKHRTSGGVWIRFDLTWLSDNQLLWSNIGLGGCSTGQTRKNTESQLFQWTARKIPCWGNVLFKTANPWTAGNSVCLGVYKGHYWSVKSMFAFWLLLAHLISCEDIGCQ